MYNTSINPVSQLLGGVAEDLDIPEPLLAAAITEYEAVGSWLADRDEGWEIYPQGSIALGTPVRPLESDEYDIDAVCLRRIKKESTTQRDLKEEVGNGLRAYFRSREDESDGPIELESRKRCWTLDYDRPFHMDVLPAVPSDRGPTGICLTDRDLVEWQYSDPKAYIGWFKSCMATELVAKRAVLAEAERVPPEEIPEYRVRTVLQQAVQVLKRHRSIYFASELDRRPPSVLLTTLAGQAYGGEADLLQALLQVVGDMSDYIEKKNGIWIVSNPVEQRENFADRWAKDPDLADQFFAWLKVLRRQLEAADEERGLHRIAARLSEGFGGEVVEKAAARIGASYREEREKGRLGFTPTTGLLSSAGTTRVRNHDFYGAS